MGNCCGSSGKSQNQADGVRPSSPGGPMTSKTSSSSTGTKLSSSTLSLTSSSTTITASSSNSGSFIGTGSISTGSGGASDEAAVYPEGRILGAPNLRTFTFTELRVATKNFKPDTVLGEGGFGRVYKGWVDEKTLNPAKPGTGMVVAIKKLNPESMQGYEEWQSEIHFLGRLSHPNLVKLLGYCWEERELLLVYEFMAKGSLENHLFRRASAPLSWELRLKIAIGAAQGLAFLHASEKQKVIYRDFKASNILLDANYNAKLSDFGLAKLGPTDSKSHVTTRVMGTYGYAAPEYVATGHLYVKSDVYGFGVVLLETLSGERALDENRPSSQEKLVDWAKPFLSQLLASNGRRKQQLARLMDPRLEGQYNSKQALQAAQLTLGCLAAEPKSRPSMNQVLDTLLQIESTPPGRRRRHDRQHHNVSTHSSGPVLHRRQRQGNGHAGCRAR